LTPWALPSRALREKRSVGAYDGAATKAVNSGARRRPGAARHPVRGAADGLVGKAFLS